MKDFERLIAINIRGVFVATQEADATHAQRRTHHSHWQLQQFLHSLPWGSVYALTKGAVAAFTKGLARDLGPRGITVNNVQPGPVDTD